MKRILTVIILLILLSPLVSPQRQPAGIGGYVYYNGNKVASAHVTVTNLNTNETVSTTTNGDGLFATSLYAETGDILKAVATYNNNSGSKIIVANLSNVTQWMNITITAGGGGGELPLIADFIYEPHNPETGGDVSFIDKSVGSITSYYWQFGDGTTSNEQNPSHVYTKAGWYYVVLTVTDIKNNMQSASKPILISSISPPPNNTIVIPPLPPPLYPENPYTIPEMYEIMGLSNQKPVNSHVRVAVIDTGITKRVFTDRNISIDLNNIIAYSISKYPSYDENGHGTFTNAEVYYAVNKWKLGTQFSIRVMSKNGECSYDDLKEAFRIAENLGCNVISISLGGIGKLGDEMDMMVRNAARHGIIVVASAGNYGPEGYSITTPALSPKAIATGAEDPMHTLSTPYDDMVTEWSSRGPVIGLIEAKPDVVAGGESIRGPYLYEDKVLSGTSMAAPLIAGSVAYMVGSNEKLLHWLNILWFWDKGINQKLVERSIEKSCRKIVGDKNSQGNGLPDIPDATKILRHEIMLHIILVIVIYIIVAVIIIFIYVWRKRKVYHKGI